MLGSEFLYYTLGVARAELRSLGAGTTFPELSKEALASFRVPVPPPSEQVGIVRFLDLFDRIIQRYIHAKQNLIALLEEQKQALIHEAVTGRIDVRTGRPYPAYKDSGFEWLQKVPAHWNRRRLKALLRRVDQRSLTGKETLLSLRRDHGVVAYAEHFSRPSQGDSLVGYKIVLPGQLVVNRMQANNGLVFCSTIGGLVSPDYSVFEQKDSFQMKFLSDLLRTVVYRAHFRREATGLGTGNSGFLRLYDENLLDTIVYLPPREEQIRVLNMLSTIATSVGRRIEAEHLSIERIGELRDRLLADVVTGKLDVRETSVTSRDVDLVY